MEPSQDCEICYQIKCKNCNWIASAEDTIKIGKGELTNCPDCEWSPN